MQLKATLLILAFSTQFIFACLWIDGTSIHGDKVRINGRSKINHLQEAINLTPENKLHYFRNHDGVPKNDEFQAVEAILEGDYSKALKELLALEEQNDEVYSIASNLGTCYELLGDNENALKWIMEGIRRKPDAHFDSEWLHRLILETKIKLKNKTIDLSKERILKLSESDLSNDEFSISIYGEPFNKKELSDSLMYQLSERLVFIKPKDPIVADLLYSLAMIEAHSTTIEIALKLLDLSKSYGFSDPKLLQKQTQRFNGLTKTRKVKSKLKIGSAVTFIFILLFGIYRYKTKRRKAKAS
ncbi:MAG: hypothetical protein NE334_19515 [Lentisphaeraceae bacterium]|nr:hypothetical protein [Lentisphaeraceae bacterium]